PTWFSTAQTADYATVFNAILPLAGLPAFLGTANYTNSERDTFTTVDVRAGFTYGNAWRVEGWATNLFNAHTIAEVLPAPEFGGSFASPGARQAFGLDVTFSF
ncbi:MAG TPA: TonB-dependent receptor, partial [Polymorphobacter sp.]|nr:TonB-dependent receptor [Polymorphobacter sp.]